MLIKKMNTGGKSLSFISTMESLSILSKRVSFEQWPRGSQGTGYARVQMSGEAVTGRIAITKTTRLEGPRECKEHQWVYNRTSERQCLRMTGKKWPDILVHGFTALERILAFAGGMWEAILRFWAKEKYGRFFRGSLKVIMVEGGSVRVEQII